MKNYIKFSLLAFSLSILLIGQAQAQDIDWLSNNFKRYLLRNDVKGYIYEAEDIIDELEGEDKERGENIKELFEMLVDENRFMSACDFFEAAGHVGIHFSTQQLNQELEVLAYKVNGTTTYILRNHDQENSYRFDISATLNIRTVTSTSTVASKIQAGVACNEVTSLNRTKKEYKYTLNSTSTFYCYEKSCE